MKTKPGIDEDTGDCLICGSGDLEVVPIYDINDEEGLPWGFARYCNGCSTNWTEDEYGNVLVSTESSEPKK